ncbi:hypothetical protein [Streptomyces sp. LUP47B]|uniref:hypothetical protein n=1 Tax=Streptomyces sp. LUP47B TaxID=1890286 RepID=UPI0008517587|nr:hypothetical protein [Streptomyces sp. LUP47B]
MAAEGVDGPGGRGAFGRRLLLAVDVHGYGRVDKTMQRQFREQMTRLLDEAADGAGLNRARWSMQEGGDSLFAVLPETVSYPALLGDFMVMLYAGLRALNRDRTAQARLRLRVAVHVGSVSLGANGFNGLALVEIGRILNCAALRNAMAVAPDASLAVAVSATVFRDAVQGGSTVIGPEEFRQVPVEEKEYRGEAWVWVPGVSRTYLAEEARTVSSPPVDEHPAQPAGADRSAREEEEPLTRDEAAVVAIDSRKTIDHALARLFLSLGPPPNPIELDKEPVSSGDGGARQ